MKVDRLIALLLGGLLAGTPLTVAGQISDTQGDFPQIVRINYVDGDVRVARGGQAHGAAWEKAVADLPLESGYSLVTGAGRAEIEFEDASTAYVGENSVVEFGDLSSTAGVPHTELALVSGTMTFNVQPMVAGEWFTVSTPTDRFSMRYPDKTYVRVNSYLDAMTVTSLGSTVVRVDRTLPVHANAGTTVTMRQGVRIFPEKPVDQSAFAAWDGWVAGRLAARSTALALAMKQAGLDSPIPGLAEMAGQGEFFDCAPYGKCWQPTNGWSGGQASQPDAVRAQTVSVAQLQQGGGTVNGGVQGAKASAPYVEDEYFPCAPYRVENLVQVVYPANGKAKKRILSSTAYPIGSGSPYDWAVCHAGSWIRARGRYAWVVDKHRHHHHPVHWVKEGRTVGYVPIHPRDVPGKAPVNLKDGLFHPVDRKSGTVERLGYEAAKPATLLAEAPKEFSEDFYPRLERAEAPKVEARRIVNSGEKTASITFDRKSQSFMVARPMEGSGKMVVQQVGPRPTGQTGGGYAGSNGNISRAGSSYSGGSSSSSGTMSHVSASAPSAAPSAPASAPAASSGASAGAKH